MKHLLTFYGDDNGRLAKVFLQDEHTYVVYMYRDMQECSHTYVDTVGQAETMAEDYVLAF